MLYVDILKFIVGVMLIINSAIFIGDGGDPVELGRLLQLVLWCAVNCNHKQGNICLVICVSTNIIHLIFVPYTNKLFLKLQLNFISVLKTF